MGKLSRDDRCRRCGTRYSCTDLQIPCRRIFAVGLNHMWSRKAPGLPATNVARTLKIYEQIPVSQYTRSTTRTAPLKSTRILLSQYQCAVDGRSCRNCGAVQLLALVRHGHGLLPERRWQRRIADEGTESAPAGIRAASTIPAGRCVTWRWLTGRCQPIRQPGRCDDVCVSRRDEGRLRR
jgi:hypothetical protein